MRLLSRCSAASAALAVALLAHGAPAMAANVNVTATFFSTFSPRHVAIGVNDTVTWNNGSGQHNVHFDDNSFIQPSPPSGSAWSVMRAFPSTGTFRYYCEVHGGPNGVGMSGTVAVNNGYPRPRGATPLRASLGIAYKQCQAPNRTHGPSLASPSCNPPAQVSDWLTVGTPDVNGATANSIGALTLSVLAGDPNTAADESDVQVTASLTDVRNKAGLSDYTGELQARLPLRLTDRKSGPSNGEPATGDTAINVVVPCTATAATGVGSTCSVTTTVDAIAPGAVPEGRRSIWETDKVQVFDGGPDGVASTADNTLFASQALFIP